MNTINSIIAHRSKYGVWSFTDLSRGLNNEPFVGNTNVIIDTLADGQTTVQLIFSGEPLPDAKLVLTYDGDEYGGVWYRSPKHKMRGWLCAAFWRYFETAPMTLWITTSNTATGIGV